jgi:hypothetical protein
MDPESGVHFQVRGPSIVSEKWEPVFHVGRYSSHWISIGSDPKNGSIFRTDAVAYLRS